MTPLIPNSTNNLSVKPIITFTTKHNIFISRCTVPRTSLPPQKYILPLSTSLRLFPQFRIGQISNPKKRTHIVSATGTTEVAAIEEAESPAASPTVDAPPKSNPAPPRSRPVRKSEFPPVPNDKLVPGATFAGKVRSVQPFGAFVDFGAFTDGLVHVSKLSDTFVKDVSTVVSVGQEVTVRLVEANLETGRISLTMRQSDEGQAGGGGGGRPRTPRPPGQKSNQKKSKFVKGQDLEGTVKNLTRAGAFISLPEDEEGFLPQSEEADEFGSLMGNSSLEIGQVVKVRVLRIARGQCTLTMKKEEDTVELDSRLSGGVLYTATNPFALAFRGDKVISEFIKENKKEEQETVDNVKEAEEKNEVEESGEKVEDESVVKSEVSLVDATENVVDELVKSEEETKEEETVVPIAEESESVETVDAQTDSSDTQIIEKEIENIVDDISETEVEAQIPVDEEKETETEPLIDESVANTIEQISAAVEEETTTKDIKAVDEDEAQTSAGEEKATETEPVIDESVANTIEIISAAVVEETTTKDTELIEKEIENIVDDKAVSEVKAESSVGEEKETETEPLIDESVANTIEQISAAVAEETMTKDIKPVDEVEAQASAGEEKATETESVIDESVANTIEQISAAVVEETTTKATISPSLVKQLRDETGAGMMDCKKALSETEGDLEKALEYLRKKGLSTADKKSSRATAEGRVGSYIHDTRIGVLIEVNCETDFVSRGDIFKELVEDLAMQVAACPQVQYLNTEDVPKEFIEREKELEMQKEDLLSRPEQIRSKIVDGRIRKRLEEMSLMEQPFIKDDKVVVKDWVKQTISTIGENIKVKRFARYNLGEGLEKKSQDFAAEVAAQTAAKPASVAVKKEAEANVETVVEPPKVPVSASLVKQLRDETGAGMMDCKKALSETSGDLEKAQEYLRKKGLSTADKKSSRLAAEGRIGSYIHDSRIGVLIEVNCETDFVGRSQNFKELVDDLSMQVVASTGVQYVSIEDIPKEIVMKEKEIELQREDILSKPENIREKIVEGRVAKRLAELALLEQTFIKDDSLLVKDLVKKTVAALGENIKVRRFVRFTMGETTADDEKSENEV